MREYVIRHQRMLLVLSAAIVGASLLGGTSVVLLNPTASARHSVATPGAATASPDQASTGPPRSVSPTPASPTPPSPAARTPDAETGTDTAPAPAPTAPKPTREPVDEPLPPPPAPEPETLPDEETCPYYDGENAPEADVGAALEAAAAARFWTVSQVSIPARLVKAVAVQESGWQSAIIACDGGIGTMQVMPATAEWMNNRFGTNHDVHTLAGNTMLGSALLQWSVKYFGDAYFDGDYTLREQDCRQLPDVPDHREWCLLNAVISAYNFGFGAVDAQVDQGTDTYYPNHRYIENVRALMSRY